MARRTQKRHRAKQTKQSKRSSSSVMTIPELRRAFEHMEAFAKQHKHTKQAVASFQEEWLRVFKKQLDKKAATVYIQHVLKNNKDNKGQAGGGGPLMGAPLDYDTRPGLYISPGVNQGSYAQVPAYVQSGFWNPEIAQTYDKVPGQTIFPTRTPLGLGDNTVIGMKGGGKKLKSRTQKRKQKGGSADPLTRMGAALNQLTFRPFGPSIPPSVGQDLQTALQGKPLGPSPSPADPTFQYTMGRPIAAQSMSINPITVNLKTDLRSN
jgi:hypothetical protein